MLTLLLHADVSAQLVRLRITDNPAYTAYPGRYSMAIVDL